MTLEGKLTNVQLDSVERACPVLCDGYDAEGAILHHDFWIDRMFPLNSCVLGDELCKYVGAPLSNLAWVRLDVAQGGEIRRS